MAGRKRDSGQTTRSEEQEAKRMKTLAAAVAGLALLGVSGASAQDYPVPYGAFYPYAGLYMAAPVGVAPAAVGFAAAPYYGAGYAPGPVPGSVVVNAYTGRWCTLQPDGWRWCWTP
jgi:hypothetical protein